MQKYLLSICCLCLVACQHTRDEQEQVAESPGPPNIIYILVDDLGYGDLSCYGQQILKTPNIDQLAAEGMMFTQHYAGSTVCGPSRASLLTGKHTGHASVRGNQPPGQLLSPEEVTIPEALKSAGYTTGIVGKWGVGHPPPPDDPARNGFDHAYGYINMWHAHNFYPEFLYLDGKKKDLEGNVTDMSLNYPAGMPEGTGVAKEKAIYTLDEFETDALSFIESNRDTTFFLYLALNAPHANNEAGYYLGDGMEVPSYGQYAERDWPNPEKGFAAMIDIIDGMVGKVMAKLNAMDIDENTLVIFTSDNGPHQEGGHNADFFDSNGPLRGKKRDLYEGGIRMPMLVHWPGKITAGSSTDHVSAFWDILPTFCEIAKVAIPDGIDGKSFLPTLLGQEGQDRHEYLYWEFYEAGGKQAVRKGDWKLVKLHLKDPDRVVETELYQLTTDRSEIKNVAGKHLDKVEELEALLQAAHTPFPGISLFDR
ncbi:MAG: arylsulfatase [Saprospiraceae bacterium]|nr:arylsulfatase [Saprospiraceae bacterium]